MAIESNIAEDDDLFVGEDKTLSFTIYQADGVTPQNVSGWAMEWVVRIRDSDTGTAIISKTTAVGGVTVTGVYNADPLVNTQRVTVTIIDTDTVSLEPRAYRHSLRRTDDGLETVLAFGMCVLRGATAR